MNFPLSVLLYLRQKTICLNLLAFEPGFVGVFEFNASVAVPLYRLV